MLTAFQEPTSRKVGELWRLHDDETLERIHEAAVHLLVHSGFRIEHEGLLDLLQAAGCRIDRQAKRCYLHEKLIQETLEHVGGHLDPAVEVPVGWNPQHHLGLGGSHPHLLDWPSGHRRLATKQDVIDIAKMGHVLDEFATVGRVLTCAEIAPSIEPLWTTFTLAQITDKRIRGGEIFYAHYIEPLVRMGEVLSGKPGDTSLIAECDFFIAPLIFDRNQADCFLEKRRFSIPNVPGTMPISGISAPVTLAGTVTIAVAELIAGWVFGYVVDPGIPVGGVVSTGSLDMRTVSACFGSPEALLQDMTVHQVCRRLYGIHVWAAINYVDCKHPGLEAAYQKMYPLVATPFGTGFKIGGDGLLSAGQDYCPVQHLLELEIRQSIDRFWGGFEVNEGTIACDLIEQVIAQGTTNFLETKHTAQHYRREQWYPKWFDRTRWQDTIAEIEGERRMLERIDRYYKDAISRYERPEISAHKIDELRHILTSAERSMVQ